MAADKPGDDEPDAVAFAPSYRGTLKALSELTKKGYFVLLKCPILFSV